ncbi:hypothetical protein AHAS_Ahas04G0098200 [Arachis hypogaea]
MLGGAAMAPRSSSVATTSDWGESEGWHHKDHRGLLIVVSSQTLVSHLLTSSQNQNRMQPHGLVNPHPLLFFSQVAAGSTRSLRLPVT